MSGYCETHRRKYIGEVCAWCADAASLSHMATMAKTSSTYRYRDVEKRRAYMRDLMRQRYRKRLAPPEITG